MGRSRDFHLSIRAGLSIGVAATVIATAALVHLPWSIASRTNLGDLNARLNALAVASLGQRVAGLLGGAVAVRQSVAEQLAREARIDDEAKWQDLFVSLLQSQPGLTAIELGFEDDHSFRARRATDGTLYTEDTFTIGAYSGADVRIFRVGTDGRLAVTGREYRNGNYFVTREFWYESAFTDDRPVWSNLYPLPASRQIGVTTVEPIARGDQIAGVLGVSISLDQLARFLDGIEISRNGTVFITNVYDQVVAVQHEMVKGQVAPGGPVVIPRLEDSQAPAVRVTAAALHANAIDLKSVGKARELAYRDPSSGASYFVTLAPLGEMGLIVCTVIPEADLFGAIDRNTNYLLAALAVFLIAVGAGATLLVRRLIGAPLGRVTDNLRQLEDFRFERIAEIPSFFTEIRQVSTATARMGKSLASFRKYIPTELVRTLFAQGIEAELGGETRELTILFMDLAHFTQISERLGDRVVGFLGDYLSEMSTLIQSNQGTIDKYIGDAIMAFWGAPVPNARHAVQACRAALACQARLAELRREQRGGNAIETHARIGLNTGRVLVGNVGSRERINYTVIGDPVNVASRLEPLNKVYGTSILIGEDTYEGAKERIVARLLDRVAVYGKERGLAVYELRAMRDEPGAADEPWIGIYERGLGLLLARDWDGAIACMERVIAGRGGRDEAASLQISRARAYKMMPPPPGWDGVVVMENK